MSEIDYCLKLMESLKSFIIKKHEIFYFIYDLIGDGKIKSIKMLYDGHLKYS